MSIWLQEVRHEGGQGENNTEAISECNTGTVTEDARTYEQLMALPHKHETLAERSDLKLS